NDGALDLTIVGGLHVGDTVPSPDLLPAQAAARDWAALAARLPSLKPDAARDAVFAFCCRHAGMPHAFRAGPLLLKSPPVVNSADMKMVALPRAQFRMGSPEPESGRGPHEGPPRQTTIARPFYLAAHPVTVAQFRAFLDDSRHQIDAQRYGTAWRFIAAE